MMIQKTLTEKVLPKSVIVILLGLLTLVSSNLYAQRLQQNQEQFRVLLFTKSLDYQHLSVPSGVQMFKEISQDNHFGLTWTEQADFFDNQAQLNSMDAIVFMNTSGDILNDALSSSVDKALVNSSSYKPFNIAVLSGALFKDM